NASSEAVERLVYLEKNGPNVRAFSVKQRYPIPNYQGHGDLMISNFISIFFLQSYCTRELIFIGTFYYGCLNFKKRLKPLSIVVNKK
ncbi:MAG: hypothetical protein AAF705_22820, partial [Bacteroidota bacterium]